MAVQISHQDQLYRQSERINGQLYTKYIEQLLSSGNAYYCFETDEELNQEREEAEKKGVPYIYSRKSLKYSKKNALKLELPRNQLLKLKK